MKVVSASAYIITPCVDMDDIISIENAREDTYAQIVRAARTCYQSDAKRTRRRISQTEMDGRFIRNLVMNGHFAMLDHASVQVAFTVDRGITHEIVRHRMAAYAQESTRYCNYGLDKFNGEVAYIDIRNALGRDQKASGLDEDSISLIIKEWEQSCAEAEQHYKRMIELGASPQIARSVLNHSTKSQIVMTADMTEWRHFFRLRAVDATGKAHPQMKEVAVPLLEQFYEIWPDIFFDIYDELED